MLKININNASFEVENHKDTLTINQEVFDGDIQPLGSNHFHILYQNRSYNAEIVKADYAEKSFTVKINGNTYQIAVQDRFDLLLEQLGMGKASKQKLNDLKAPMPGLILDILVKEGDKVKKGDNLLILEAMKMENMIKSTGEGTVKSIKTSRGDRVEKNHVLIVFD
ncbi:acetyl-CoA carboxylase biotin carboxyl carrier protein subunit [Thermoflexibacter ruber]|uniref:Biotin-requiring enzyme n=1 Tax=Thermoflexibacter ruber TaxID=1003 RepID=A0A1I2IF07_9BACT|nr:acetyl-CoA carboxylase biotin carboxyl carrier protein subunit [Thermoflexibacter ruber]SFF39121.1 Biotin-requiring enzyme [Thermoflexibacter ruber]